MMVVEGVALCFFGIALFTFGFRSARRHGLLDRTYWQSFLPFLAYRIKRLYAPLIVLAGILLIGWGGSLLYASILGFYAARLGHFGP